MKTIYLNFEITPNEINSVLYNLEGKRFKNIQLEFDFENDKLTIDGKTALKVERDWEFTYKFMKTKIKAIDGIQGLYKHIKEAAEPGAFWNNRMFSILSKAGQGN